MGNKQYFRLLIPLHSKESGATAFIRTTLCISMKSRHSVKYTPENAVDADCHCYVILSVVMMSVIASDLNLLQQIMNDLDENLKLLLKLS